MKNKNLNIFLISFLMLFLEMFLIRWLSTEIRIFAYVSNLALLACFIGIGMGCYFSDKKANILVTFIALAITILEVKSIPFLQLTDMLGTFSDYVIWSQTLTPNILISSLKGIFFTLFMFMGIVFVFFPLGQILAKIFDSYENIIFAYSINVLGSIIGIWLFSLLSFFYIPPIIWLIISMFCGFIFIKREVVNICIYLFLLLFSSSIITVSIDQPISTIWSPYQKLSIYGIALNNTNFGYTVNVNNANYMELLDTSPKFVKSHPEIFGENSSTDDFGQYAIPYMFKNNIQDVLIVGSGGGNDVAGAIRSNISNINAVEIDPGVYNIGLKFHPENPYHNKRVHVFIDDARSFFKKNDKKYDVISFGLLDSHTISSSYNNIRLDHYIYTVESFKEANKLLKDDGIITVAFASTRPWIAKRLFNLLKNVFNENPIVFNVSPYGENALNRGWIMYVVSNNMQKLREKINSNSSLINYIQKHEVNLDNIKVNLTTDDWPYLYLKNHTIPKLHLCLIVSLLIILAIGKKAIFSEGKRLNLHFFFLGTAFLLLEFQNVSKSCLLFGSTWLVNSYTFSAILILILFANITVYYLKRISIYICYLCLLLSLLLLYLVPLNIFNSYSYFIKGFLVSVFLNIPIFFAGIIFIQSFKKTKDKSIAFGSNLLGAAFGGILESVSFITGIKFLLVLVFIFYVLSYIFSKKLLVNVK